MADKKLESKNTDEFWVKLIIALLIPFVILGIINVYLWYCSFHSLDNFSLIELIPYFIPLLAAISFIGLIHISYHKKPD